MFHSNRYPDPTTPREERLPDDDVSVEELTQFMLLSEQVLPLEDSWELSQALQYCPKSIYILPTGYVIA